LCVRVFIQLPNVKRITYLQSRISTESSAIFSLRDQRRRLCL